ncbi:Microtubule-associated protein, microtubule dynamics during spindle orientation [Maudiozyma exigua]|uniref:Microtubule-associated protein, microtubule dynamics during spindle orientation n=1 Tax=Maudiozyma exigua TaxID=34358 RepID=A0A9P6VWG0_MAUEX|nr:Microtubule-associated protein, microtubule dynamics during spindle orientation [Kazachstania exigua]
MNSSNIGTPSASDDIDFNKLSLQEKLSHKNWKGRSLGYQQLTSELNSAVDITQNATLLKYWNDPAWFNDYILDTNVVAHEHAIIALHTLITLMKPITNDIGTRIHPKLNVWVPSLIEKGLGSSRQNTSSKAMECIMMLCSLDDSIDSCVDLSLSFLDKKLPRLLNAVLLLIGNIINEFGIVVKLDIISFLDKILTGLPKLASHADKKVRDQVLNVILQIYIKINSQNELKMHLQNFISENLKSIQQKELIKLFESVASEQIQQQEQHTLFERERRQRENDNANVNVAESQEQQKLVDEDGDTIMLDKEIVLPQVDVFVTLPKETTLDKLPEQFYDRAQSSKWKDRVEALEEFHSQILIKCKRIEPKANYNALMDLYANIISKDVNLQVVTLATQSIYEIFTKIDNNSPNHGLLNKNYCSLVFEPLLLRTKEKKNTTIEPIRQCLKMICSYYNPLFRENEEMLFQLLIAMKFKIPQVRLECTTLFIDLLTTSKQFDKQYILSKLKSENVKEQDSAILPIVLKIVNDTQPTLRNIGFQCMATLIKLFGERYFIDTLEHLDNMKRNKIMDLVSSVTITASATTPQQIIPSKRPPPQRITSLGNTSPLKRSNVLNKDDKHSSKNIKLLKVTHTPPKVVQNTPVQPVPNAIVTTLQKENTILNNEKTSLSTELNQFRKDNEQLLLENKNLKEEKQFLKNTISEKDALISSKLHEIQSLNDKINDLERQIISLRDKTTSTAPVRTASSDDLRRGVGSLRLNSSIESTTSSNLNLNFGLEKTQTDSKTINNDNEDSWKRAAEVTKMLKERIEKMRARTK